MKHGRIALVVALFLLLALVSANVGCGRGGNGATDIADMMKRVPIGTESFTYEDTEAMLGDGDLKDLYKYEEFFLQNLVGDFGIGPQDVTSRAQASWGFRDDSESFGFVRLYAGSFDLGQVRDALRGLDYEEREYKDVEVWKSSYGYDDGYDLVALTENLVIDGNEEAVRDCIKVIKGEKESFYHDQDVIDMMDRLPSGLAMGYGNHRIGQAFYLPPILFMGYGTNEQYEGLQAIGWSTEEKDHNNMRAVVVLQFEEEDVVWYAMDEIEDVLENLEGWGKRRWDIHQDGKSIIVTAEATILGLLLEREMRIVQDAVYNHNFYHFDYSIKDNIKYPTADGKGPPEGGYAPIDFGASLTNADGKTLTFYPDFLETLPRHHDKGVWRVGDKLRVSVDMDPEEYYR